jgi:trimeric autotransporter adhesin
MHQKSKLIRLIALLFICFGLAPMAQAVGPDTDGKIPGANNGEGVGVLVNRTFGVWNTGTGFEALNNLTDGNQNTATGLRALFNDTSGGYNTATGVYSLFGNTSGFFNTATGAYSLAHNTDGSHNTANGYLALYFNTEGDFNTATGSLALYGNTQGDSNNAFGWGALLFNTIGSNNTAIGFGALLDNKTGNGNTALGMNAGFNLTTGDGNVCIGANVGGVVGESNTTRIRNIYASVASERAVYVNSDNKIGTLASSRRFKEEIKPMDKASEVLFALKPVSFRYKKEFDAGRAPMFGLIAEDVKQVNPDLVSRNEKGEVETVRYEQINAMLLNEFLKAHSKLEQQEATIVQQQTEFQSAIAQQRKEMETVIAQLKEQAAQIQRVSAQLEVNKTAPQIVLKNQ